MITALIVEDESRIRNGLFSHIPWEQLQVDEVQTAEHAEEAFSLCQTFRPDIIVSDICMPGMNGVELCKKLKENFSGSQIIFVTGYAEKEYLKAAIDLHAISFVEKPIQLPEVIQAVRMAVEEVKKVRSYDRTFFSRILKEGIESSEVKGNNFSVFLIRTSEDITEQFYNELIAAFKPLAEKWKISILGEVLETKEAAFLLSGNHAVSGDKWFMHEVYGRIDELQKKHKFFMGIGKEVSLQKEVPKSYESARNALKCLSFLGWNHYAFEKDLPENEYEDKLFGETIEQFHSAVVKKDTDGMEAVLDDIYQNMIKNKAVINGKVKHLYYSLLEIMNSSRIIMYDSSNLREETKPSAGKVIEQAQTLEEIQNFFKRELQSIGEPKEEDTNIAVVQKIQQYIADHYSDKELSVKVLADFVYLTPTYLSNLFKKSTGYTIGQYLLDIRIEAAKQLLRNPEYKLYQVATMVGYEDSNYFTKIFKKKTDMTPSEYRKKW